MLVRCPGCQSLHLIADNLGWFDDEKVNIETIMQEQGQNINRVDSLHGLELLQKSK